MEYENGILGQKLFTFPALTKGSKTYFFRISHKQLSQALRAKPKN
jgi:hypothetical protein